MGRKKLLPEEGRSSYLHSRVYPSWRVWLGRYATFKGMSIIGLIEWAVARAAKGDKFEPPPGPPRQGKVKPKRKGDPRP